MKNLKLGLVAGVLGLLASSAVFAQVKPIDEVFEPSMTKFPVERFGKVAVVQWNQVTPTPLGVSNDEAEAFKQKNRDELASYIRQAASNGAKLVVTPEFGIVGYPVLPNSKPEDDNFRNREDLRPYVEPANGPTFQYFSALASELGIYIHVGIAEADSESSPYYNTVIAIDPQGNLVATFRKINLFEKETQFLEAGSEPVTYDGMFGKVGLALCADIYSSNPMDAYRQQGVDVVALSTSWDRYNTGYDTFAAAAKRLKGYVMAANQTYFPDSGVINPNGTPQSHIRQSTGVAYGYLPLVR